MKIIGKELIHFTSLEEGTEIIQKLTDDGCLCGSGTRTPAEWWKISGERIFKNCEDADREMGFLTCVNVDDTDQKLVYSTSLAPKNSNPDNFKSEFENSAWIDLETCEYLEAEDFLDSGFSMTYDIYDEEDNYFTSVKNPRQLLSVFKNVLENHLKLVSYVNGQKVVIDDEHDIDYYDSIFIF